MKFADIGFFVGDDKVIRVIYIEKEVDANLLIQRKSMEEIMNSNVVQFIRSEHSKDGKENMQFVTHEEFNLLMSQLFDISNKIKDVLAYQENLEKSLDDIQQRVAILKKDML